MMYKETRVQEIPCISFLKGTKFNLYVGPKLSWFERRKLRKVECKYSVLYLYDFAEWFTAEKLSYNFPGIEFPEGFSLDTIYENIKESIGGINPESKFFIRYDGQSFVVFSSGSSNLDLAISYLVNNGLRFTEEETEDDLRYRECDDDVETCIDAMLVEPSIQFDAIDDLEEIEEDDEDVKEDIRFSIRPSEEEKETIRFRISEPEHSPDIRYRASERSSVADSAFDAEMTKAAKEVKDAIDALLMTGFPVDIIQSWLNEKVKLSRIRITRQFKILLVDYDKEIKMGPLPKTVFLFYLRHPEGVKFSYLQDHINELLHIYGHVSVNDDLKKMRESIASLIDPFNNSICEKCAAIKKAFVLQVKDSVAKNYYVTGMQGGKKGIALDRRLVEWECEL